MMSKASGFFVEPFLSGPIQTARLRRSVIGTFVESLPSGPIQTARLRRSVIGTPDAKKLLSHLGFSRPAARATGSKKNFAELFFKTATSSSP
jgi:hypothetical protein